MFHFYKLNQAKRLKATTGRFSLIVLFLNAFLAIILLGIGADLFPTDTFSCYSQVLFDRYFYFFLFFCVKTPAKLRQQTKKMYRKIQTNKKKI